MTDTYPLRAGSSLAMQGEQPPMSKTAYVLERLRREIATGLVVPGASLRQAEIAERYGVSATPVREALRLLEAEGTISYAPHRGATVRELSPRRQEDVALLRAAIEGLATEVAAQRLQDSSVERILTAKAELQEAFERHDSEAMAVLNRRMHFAIYEAGSETMAAQAANLWTLFPPKVSVYADERAARELMEEHDGILEAVLAHDPALAKERAVQHIFHAAEWRRTLSRPLSQP